MNPIVADRNVQVGYVTYQQPAPQKFMCRVAQTGIASTGGGNINFNIPLYDPSAANNWSTALVNLFDQYRVTHVRVTIFPQPYNETSTITAREFYLVVDYDSTTAAPTGVATALEYDTCRVVDLRNRSRLEVNVPRVTAANVVQGWCNVAAPYANGCIGLNAYSLSASVVYIDTVLIDYTVEFNKVK